MAYTVTKTPSVFGNVRVVVMDVTADAATQTIETGLKNVIGFSIGNKSGASGWKVWANSNTTGAVSGGVIAVSSATSGDQAFIIVFGF